ncbi:hypothetical protein CQW23_23617 [Capsicum baccatum]|uniref:Rubicon Homology domain-containing protein n=1 Tax=Capsicum baccatum TaxID=33114 RepID=A0A2G2VSF7_CAPBA|nr:hypothetical protein CQW23_23617 [Capsicum baccatum]
MTKIERVGIDTGLTQRVDLSIDQYLDLIFNPRGAAVDGDAVHTNQKNTKRKRVVPGPSNLNEISKSPVHPNRSKGHDKDHQITGMERDMDPRNIGNNMRFLEGENLPVMVETILRKILEHIAEQCLICCDVGIPCNAPQTCDDPSYLIFPFLEKKLIDTSLVGQFFHKHCFRRISSCPCGIQFNPKQGGNTSRVQQSKNSVGNLSRDLPGKNTDLSTKGLLSRLLSKVRSLKSSEDGEQRPEDKSTVIVTGSLPLTNL